MDKARYLYSELASAIEARKNCDNHSNTEWFDKWTKRIHELEDMLPHGSGFDNGTKVDISESHSEKLLLLTSYHHMNDGGYYDGWTEHIVTVTPSFQSGFNLRISGRNRNNIKEYMHETFSFALAQEVGQIKA